MEIRTMFDRKRVYTEAGSPLRPDRAGVLDKKGNIVVKTKGTINQYAFINSFASSCDLNVLIARFRAGDTTALNQRAGAYIDISNIPDNINDIMALHYNLEQYFNSLPANVRSAFDNSVNVFISNVGDPDFKKLMEMSEDQINKKLAKEAMETDRVNKTLVNPGLSAMDIDPAAEIPLQPVDTGLGSPDLMMKGVKI